MAAAHPPKHVDRTLLVPRHAGDYVLPNFGPFTRLVRFAHQSPAPIAVRDVNLGAEKSYLQLLTDVLALRRVLIASLAPLQHGPPAGDVFIGLLAPGGYEYTVGFMTILSLGAAVVPMATSLPAKEASYFVSKSRCIAILSSSAETQLGESLATLMNEQGTPLACIPITPHLQPSPLQPESITISSDAILDPNGAGLVIFTSGTTGPPKGAVQRRGYICASADGVAHHYKITSADTVLHVLPVHHATGIGISFLPFLLSGACVEFRSGSFDEAWTWERWRKGGLAIFSGVPTIYMRMKRYYDQVIAKLPLAVREEYVAGARGMRALVCGSSAFPAPVEKFWAGILGGGRRIITRYGATEFGAVFSVGLDVGQTPEGSVGRVMPGVTVKLAGGDEGMVLVKGPQMFSGYLFDEKATAAAHDKDGFFLTGDIARREGSYYYILGRASIDIIKSGGYKISALDVEREILGLPYVSEVMVVGVEDEEFGQRVAAAITLRGPDGGPGHGIKGKELTIGKFRSDLRAQLTGYKMPTLLRVVEGDLPKSGTGKVQKKILGPKYFPSSYRDDPEVQVWTRGVSKL